MVQIILTSEQHSERNNYKQYWLLISATSHLQTSDDQMWSNQTIIIIYGGEKKTSFAWYMNSKIASPSFNH